MIVGIEHFLDWMQHTEEAEELVASVKSLNLDKNDPAFDEKVKPAGASLKAVIQSIQTPATTYFNALNDLTVPRITKRQRLEQAFQKVLDDPADQEALQHPALKPLLGRWRLTTMSDHFSGPRAIAGPAGDITDLYAFPSPERPGHLVLVLDVHPTPP